MKLDRWAFALFALGVAVIIAAIFWSLSAYGEVGRMVASQGPPAHQQLCLLRLMGGALRAAQRGPCREGHDWPIRRWSSGPASP